MESAAADLLAALSSPSSHASLHSRFAAYLEPFRPHFPSSNPNPKPPPKRTTKQNKQQQQPQSDAVALRPLAKRFLPFVARALQLLPPLVRSSTNSGDVGGRGADELLEIYGLLLDCLSAISPCLAGKPYSVLLQRGRFVCCLESRGHLTRAEVEAAATLDALRSVLSPSTTSTKSRRGAASGVYILPDPGVAGETGTDPEVTILAVELTVCLANCASKGNVKEVAPYERVLSLVQQLQPWLPILAEDVRRRYLTLLVNAMSRCTLFLVAEPLPFNADLVHGFCIATLEECTKAQMIERLLSVASKVCSSVDLSWAGSTKLLLDLLNNVIASVAHVKADSLKVVNEFLVFVAYFSRCFLSANRDVRIGASELFYKQGGYFSEVSPPTASVLLLYATGLYFSTQQAENDESPCMTANILNNKKYLQVLNKALDALAQFFCFTNGRSIPLCGLTKDSNYSQPNGDISFVAYLDSLEFLCKMLLQPANAFWKLFSDGKEVHYSGDTDFILTALHQFSDSSLAAYSCTKMSEGDKGRLHEQRGTLLRALISAIRISFVMNKDVQKSLSFVNCAVSSSWLTLEELKFLISSLGNVGVTLHNTGHFKEAPKALELCCQTIWAHVRFFYCRLLAKADGSKAIEVLPNDTLKDVIVDSFARITKMVDTLYRCAAKMTCEIVVKSLSELLAYGNTSEYFDSSLTLIKLWVKITCKDFKDDDDQGVDSAPLLYHSLLSYPSPLPKKLIGLIVEQELLAYGLMEARNKTFCAKMQMRIIDILFNELYCSKEYNLERSRVLVRKAGALRASGVKHIHSCLKYLSEAISLLDSSRNNPSVTNQLAIAYCLYAHCAQEGNLDGKVILESAENAYKLLSKTGTFDHSSPGPFFEQPPKSIVPLLCSLVDLFAIKGCFELQFDLCKLMTKIWRQENLPLEKLFSSLFNNGRLSHACCHIPMDQQFISYVTEHLGIDCRHTEFWRNCFKGDNLYLAMFLQRMLCSDLFSSQSCEFFVHRQFNFDVSVDEVEKAAASLISEVTSDDQSLFIASHLYYDLSERLLSGGQLFKAFSYGREALHLRRKLLKRKFKLTSAGTGNEESQRCGQGLVSLEAWGGTIADIWPDSTRSTSTKDCFLTPWNVLRYYLESTFQVAKMNELTGNGAEAEVLLRSGKEMSSFHELPVFCIAFTSLLGQLYCKRQLWEEAEGELKYARDLLSKYDAIISCKLCKLILDISIDLQVGDMFWSLFKIDFQKESKTNLSSALGTYQTAMKKLSSSGLEFVAGSYDSLKSGSRFCCRDCVAQTKHEIINLGEESIASKDGMLPSCHVSALLREESIDHCTEHMVVKGRRKNSRNAEAGLVLDAKAKRASTRLAKEHNLETNPKTRTRAKRITHVKADKASTELNRDNDFSGSHELSADALICGQENYFPDGFDCRKDDICSMFGCWNCLYVKSLSSGHIQNILQFRCDWVHRRYLVSLLLKIARASGADKGHRGGHEVHCVYWQCISLLYFISLPQDCYKCYGLHLVRVIMNGNSGDFLPLERAEILYSMSFFLLKGILSEQSRAACCSFSSVEMPDVVPWLLKASVLSGESPLLLQEICKLLACIFLLSTIDSSIQMPLFPQGSLSLNHWAAYFHHISVGTHLNCQYLATLHVLPREKISKGSPVDFRKQTDGNVLKFLRFPAVDIQHIEKHIIDFFDKLPDVPIMCISVFGDDYVNVLRESLLIPSSFPAWMLLSRFDSTSKPTTILMPVGAIPEEIQPEDSSVKDFGDPTSVLDKKWRCPWGYSIIDYVAPAFKNILEENFISLSSASLTTNDVQSKNVRWWSHRMKLNNYLDNVLKDIEESWLGPWKCLLLGCQLADQHIEAAYSNIIVGLEKEFKLEINQALIKAILGSGVSVDEVQECVYQLILYKGYFGRGRCCGKDTLRAFSSRQIVDKDLETLRCLIKDATRELPEPVHREPVIFVLDINVQMLPWENLPVLRNQEIYRMPSIGSILFSLTRNNDRCKDGQVVHPPFPMIDPFNTFYLLNPSGDLSSTQKEFDQLFRNYEWKGKAGSRDPIKAEELILALINHDLFVYFGHGSGSQYVSGKDIEKLDSCAAALLMGCSSGTLQCKGSYAPRGAPLSYLSAGSPAVIANLWDVSDKDIDRFSKALLDSWLQENIEDGNNCSQCCQLTQDLEALNIAAKDNGRTRRKITRGKRSQKISSSANCCTCRRRRIATYLSEARRACRLPLLIGASPVCYGVPTIIRKK